MPSLPPLTIPPDAFAKADEKAKTTDFYADMSDDERIEEGLPAREAEKPAPAPEPEKKPDAEPEPDDEEQEADAGEALDRLFAEIAGLKQDVSAALEKPEPKTEKQEDAQLQALLESDDPEKQYLAQRLQAANERLERIENEAREQRVARQMAKDDAEFDAVQASYLIDGKPMTDEQVAEVEKYMLQHPEVGRTLSPEQATRVVFPGAAKGSKPAPAKPGPAGSNGDGPTVATIVDAGSTPAAAPEKWKPGPNETMETAMKAAGRIVLGLKR